MRVELRRLGDFVFAVQPVDAEIPLMTVISLLAWSIYFLYAPFVAILLILTHYALRRILWRSGRRAGFCPSACALGMAFQYMQVWTRPNVEYVLAEKQKEDAEEDGEGDPDSPEARLRHFHRQLRGIRRGDPVERLVLRI
jgi:hypothetical protein